MQTKDADAPVTMEQVLARFPAQARLGSKAGMEKVKLVASGVVWAAREHEVRKGKKKGRNARQGVISVSADFLEPVHQWLCKWANKTEFRRHLAAILECPEIQVELALQSLRERRSFLAYKAEVKKREKQFQQAIDRANRR